MKEQFDIAPTRKRANVTAREVEVEAGFPLAALGAIEDGRIGIDTDTHEHIHAAIRTIAERKATECQQTEAAALAGT